MKQWSQYMYIKWLKAELYVKIIAEYTQVYKDGDLIIILYIALPWVC